MRIGIDLDGVLADFTSNFLDISRRTVGRPDIRVTHTTDWDFKDILTKAEVSKVWSAVINTRNFWMNLEREKGVSSLSLRNIAKMHDLIFITARAHTKGYSVQQQSAAWLALEFGLKWPTVIEEGNKGPLASALHLDYFIDDRPNNCLEIMDAVPHCKCFLKDLPHNKLFVPPLGLRRVRDFNEFAEIVLKEMRI